MATTKISSRKFNQDVGGAKRAAAKGPVVITDRGRPAHVLLSIEDYKRLTEGSASIVDLIADKRAARIEFDVERVAVSSLQIPELPE
jgi:prevent-host-death family protein